MNDPKKIIDSFESFISKNGGGYAEWYVGLSSRIVKRLYLEHGVDADNDPHVIHQIATNAIGRQVKQHFLSSGCDGEPTRNNLGTRHVYVYKKTDETVP